MISVIFLADLVDFHDHVVCTHCPKAPRCRTGPAAMILKVAASSMAVWKCIMKGRKQWCSECCD